MTVWCCVSAKSVIGPFFFEDTRSQPVTVNGDRYREIIRDFVIPNMRENGMKGYWFQQDVRYIPHSTQNNGLIQGTLR